MKRSKAPDISIAHWLLLIAIFFIAGAQIETHGQTDGQVGDGVGQASQGALKAFSDDLESLTASFEQSSIDGSGYLIEQLDGVFYFQSPNQFRWAYSEPMPELIVGDGEQLWHFDPSLEQATVRAQPPASDLPILALTDPAVMAASYSINPGEQANTLRFIPTDADAPIAEALVQLEEGRPVVVEWVDDFGQRTRIVFIDMRVNQLIDPAMFRFVPPAGIDVLEGL